MLQHTNTESGRAMSARMFRRVCCLHLDGSFVLFLLKVQSHSHGRFEEPISTRMRRALNRIHRHCNGLRPFLVNFKIEHHHTHFESNLVVFGSSFALHLYIYKCIFCFILLLLVYIDYEQHVCFSSSCSVLSIPISFEAEQIRNVCILSMCEI